MTWKAILILPLALAAGCAQTTSGDYCDIASPLYFGSDETVVWLFENDDRLLVDIVVNNETHKSLCGPPS